MYFTFHIQPQIISFYLCPIKNTLTDSVWLYSEVTSLANHRLGFITSISKQIYDKIYL